MVALQKIKCDFWKSRFIRLKKVIKVNNFSKPLGSRSEEYYKPSVQNFKLVGPLQLLQVNLLCLSCTIEHLPFQTEFSVYLEGLLPLMTF